MVDAGNYYALVRTHTYEPGCRRLAPTALNVEGTAGTSYASAYSHDSAGNLARIDSNPTQAGVARDTQCFDHDGLRRLTSAWTLENSSCAAVKITTALGGPAEYWTDFTYDPIGNCTSTTDHTTAGAEAQNYAYPASGQGRPHAVASVRSGASQSTFGYDETGKTAVRDLPGQGTQTLTWDVEGERDSVEQAGTQGVNFIYTADGDRLVRTQEGVTTVHLPGGQELALTASDQQEATRYYSFNGETIALRTGPRFDDVTTLTSDHQATATAAVTNISCGITRRYGTPFGSERGQTSAMPGDHGFLDKPEDTTGLTSIGARYYDNTTGHFISVDPIMDVADSQQWAAYNCANNNPTTWSDPTGMIYCGSSTCAQQFEYGTDKKTKERTGTISTRTKSGPFRRRKTVIIPVSIPTEQPDPPTSKSTGSSAKDEDSGKKKPRYKRALDSTLEWGNSAVDWAMSDEGNAILARVGQGIGVAAAVACIIASAGPCTVVGLFAPGASATVNGIGVARGGQSPTEAVANTGFDLVLGKILGARASRREDVLRTALGQHSDLIGFARRAADPGKEFTIGLGRAFQSRTIPTATRIADHGYVGVMSAAGQTGCTQHASGWR